jgi:chitin synthase
VSIRGDTVSLKAKGGVPCQMLFCLNSQRTNRLQCHRWFFQAFCGVLNPNICILLDASTRPGPVSIYNMWRAMDIHTNCGIAIGQVNVMLRRGYLDLLNPLIAVQHFEYNMRNLLGRPFESLFGFTYDTVDSFCGYRYTALRGDVRGNGPLNQYFAAEESMSGQPTDWISSGYLTRLSFEVVLKRHGKWKLKYVPSSQAEADCPVSISQYLLQRRGLLKGNLSFTVYALGRYLDIFRSGHCILKKAFLSLQNLHQAFKMLVVWFSMVSVYLYSFK